MYKRKIKFRGQTVSGRWVYGNLNVLQNKLRNVDAGAYISNISGSPFAYQVRPETIGQFTGAKDMHGTDIYEGDIIRKEECSPDDIAFGHYGSVGVVKYDTNVMGFIIDYEDDGFYDNMGVNFSFNEIEVVGNIHDNPDIIHEVI